MQYIYIYNDWFILLYLLHINGKSIEEIEAQKSRKLSCEHRGEAEFFKMIFTPTKLIKRSRVGD